LNLRFDPDGLFDFGRINAVDSELNSAELNVHKFGNGIRCQVVEAQTCVLSQQHPTYSSPI